MVPKSLVEARSSVPISNVGDTAVEDLSASLASERSVKSIIEVARSVNFAPPSFPIITGIAHGAHVVHAAHRHHHHHRRHVPARATRADAHVVHAAHHHHHRRRHVPARATRAADIKTVTQIIYLVNVDKEVPNLVPVTATNAPATWPPLEPATLLPPSIPTLRAPKRPTIILQWLLSYSLW